MASLSFVLLEGIPLEGAPLDAIVEGMTLDEGRALLAGAAAWGDAEGLTLGETGSAGFFTSNC